VWGIWIRDFPGLRIETRGTQHFGVWSEGRVGVFVVVETGEGLVGEAGGVAYLGIGETQALAFEDKLNVIDELHAMRLCESLSTFADKIDVGTFLEHESRGVDWIAEAFDAGYAAGFHAAAVHEKGVELDATVGGEEATATGVEGGIVFENCDCSFNGIDGCAAAGEDFMTDLEGVAHSGFMGRCGVGRDGPRATVNEEGRIVRGGEGAHRTMVVHLWKHRCTGSERVNETKWRWYD
jgi:hypothetical protein